MTKTKEQIRDAECDKHGYAMEKKYNQIELANMPSIIMDESFKAGFDFRDKLDNEALKIAVEALEYCANNADPINDMATAQKFLAMRGICRINLAAIRKLRGERDEKDGAEMSEKEFSDESDYEGKPIDEVIRDAISWEKSAIEWRKIIDRLKSENDRLRKALELAKEQRNQLDSKDEADYYDAAINEMLKG